MDNQTILNRYKGDNKVLQFFEELSQIPRGSGNEKAISDYIADFARKRHYSVVQDDKFNLIIRKPAAPGYENAPTVIFQGHLDMVCEKNKGTVHDFTKDPIRFKIDGDFIYAEDTTLGADNGIAVATAMAILASPELDHPELEILLTTEEETTMGGACHLDTAPLKGRLMINFDSDREGSLFVSCAGGVNIFHTVPIIWQERESGASEPFTIGIQGLAGGHSGDDIIHERGNANKLLGRVLDDLRRHTDFALAGIGGGMKVNAIPREAQAAVYLNAADLQTVTSRIAKLTSILLDEFKASDKGVNITLQNGFQPDGGAEIALGKVFSEQTKTAVIRLLALIPNGVLSMDKSIPNLVRTSSNIGVVTTATDEVVMQSLTRSSHRSQLDAMLQTMETLAQTIGCGFRHDSYFPGWPYRANSKLQSVFQQVYERKFEQPLEIKAIHAGLECGVFIDKMPELDAVSFGPNLYDIHTPQEHLSISSVERTWTFLLDVLRELKETG